MATAADDGAPGLEPELILVAHPDAQLRLHEGRAHAAAGDIGPLNAALDETAVEPQALFGASETRVLARHAGGAIGGARPLGLLPRPARAGRRSRRGGRAAHAGGVGRGRVREAGAGGGRLLRRSPRPRSCSTAASADFTSRQSYLDAAPGGVNARSAWTTAGGDGAGMEVMVVGGAWRLEHEDLHGDAAGVIAGTQIDALSFRNHGTAMLGVVRADRNSFGVTGVAPACRARQVATFGLGTAAAINAAADALPVGGILLVEWQRPGPGGDGRRLGGLHRARVVAGRLRRHQGCHGEGRDRRRAGRQRRRQPRRSALRPARCPVSRRPGATRSTARRPTRARSSWARARRRRTRTAATTGPRGHGSRSPTTACASTHRAGARRSRRSATATCRAATSRSGTRTCSEARRPRPRSSPGSSPRFRASTSTVRSERRSRRRTRATPCACRARRSRTAPTRATQRIGSLPELPALIALLPPRKSEAKDGKDSKNEGKDNKDNKDGKDNKDNPDKLQKEQTRTTRTTRTARTARTTRTTRATRSRPRRSSRTAAGRRSSPTCRTSPNLAPAPAAWPVVSTDPVQHFIPPEHRPDLATAALRDEPDVAAVTCGSSPARTPTSTPRRRATGCGRSA